MTVKTMVVKMRSIATAAAAIFGVAVSASTASGCTGTVIAYQASGEFGANVVSGADILKLASQPFSITLYACSSEVPKTTGSYYAAYSPIQLSGQLKSQLETTPFTIPPETYISMLLVTPSSPVDSVQLKGSVDVYGTEVTVTASVALPLGTLTSVNPIATFPSTTIVTSKSYFTYADSKGSTTLSVIGTASGTSKTQGGAKADALLHSGDVQVITVHADGTQSVRPLQAAPVDLRALSDKVMLRLYASGVRDAAEVRVQVGGQEAPVRYAGASGHFPGLDEVTVELPRSLAGMGDADVLLTVAGQTASPVRIHIQ